MHPVEPADLKFAASDEFHRVVRRRVSQYFELSGLRERDCPQMYVKTAILFAWTAVSYSLLVFFPMTWWLACPLAISLGLSMAAIGFNVMHDGGHRAYSNHLWINRFMAMALDLLGGSSHCWARKHNVIHHSFSNITGHDDDIDIGILGRLSPHQQRMPFHRMQHYYLWGLYGFLPVKWFFFDDFRDLLSGEISGHRLPRPKGWDLVVLVVGKIAFFTLAFLVPLLLHPTWAVLSLYFLASFVQGVVLSVVFQLAHCVENATFPMPHEETGRMDAGWSVHQVETTVDFARENRVLSWFIGGLNFQIEHHLFPRICHIHYHRLAPLVETTCREFGVNYTNHISFSAAVTSHFRWLRRMGTE